jgi:hypothetical protein
VSLASFAAGTYFFLANPEDTGAPQAAPSSGKGLRIGSLIGQSGAGLAVGAAF